MNSPRQVIMVSGSLVVAFFIIAGAFLFVSVVGAPEPSRACFNAADIKCIPGRDYTCPCFTPADQCPKKLPGGQGCLCTDSCQGITTGGCVSEIVCEAKSSEKSKDGGGGMGDMKQFMDMLKSLLDKLKGGGGDKKQPDQTQQNVNQQYPPCVYNEATKTYSPIPCKNTDSSVNYGGTSGTGLDNINTGGSIGRDLWNSLNGDNSDNSGAGDSDTGDSGSSVYDTVKDGSSDSGSGDGSSDDTTSSTTDGVSLKPGLKGDVYIGDSGGGIIVKGQNEDSAIAGFYGGGAFGMTQSKSIIGRLCESRPWSTGLIAALISPSFFDGLCAKAGYHVGPITQASGPSLPNRIFRPSTTTPREQISIPLPTGQPSVDIWAEPAIVRLGSRTYIFWNTKNVLSCKERGPSFTQNSPSGGASTVPISDASTFTISCLTAASTTIEDSVTVHLAI